MEEKERIKKVLGTDINAYLKNPHIFDDSEPKGLTELMKKYKTRDALAKALGKDIAVLRYYEKIIP